MDDFFEHLMVRAATIDELLSDKFEPMPGQKRDADRAGQRLAAWCRSCASGDWLLFARRLERDGLSIAEVMSRFATVRPRAKKSPLAWVVAWVDDAIWVEAVLREDNLGSASISPTGGDEHYPFETLFLPLAEKAEEHLWHGMNVTTYGNLEDSARTCLRCALLKSLTMLCAPALHERFTAFELAQISSKRSSESRETVHDRFIKDLKAGSLRELFREKPVLLRLIAVLVRQWIKVSREFLHRLDVDLEAIRSHLLRSNLHNSVVRIESGLSDPHNGGRTVRVVQFSDGSRVVYKPRSLQLDAAWCKLVTGLNVANPPIELRPLNVIAREGYGWTEFIAHEECQDAISVTRFFQRSGAWLALFHCFAAIDMHHENIIACGDHPVPIDLEMVLQAARRECETGEPELQAIAAAAEIIENSVAVVGLLPAHGRSATNEPFTVGGMTSNWKVKRAANLNVQFPHPHDAIEYIPNLPRHDGRYATLGEHIKNVTTGFGEYAHFLAGVSRADGNDSLFETFSQIPNRRLLRPTRFYYMLLQRLRDHRAMSDGVTWSAQAEFPARLYDWEKDNDVLWPLMRAELHLSEKPRLVLAPRPVKVTPHLPDGQPQMCDQRVGGRSTLQRAPAQAPHCAREAASSTS
jgi:type 2 lantibiotic biosynthesis protein LanM